MDIRRVLVIIYFIAVFYTPVLAQSSSLYVQRQNEGWPSVPLSGPNPSTSVLLAEQSLVASGPEIPRQYGLHDLITIIIREATSTDFTASLDTYKEVEFQGQMASIPDLEKLIKFQLGNMEQEEPIRLDLDYSNEFEGEGKYKRSETITGRITARIIDIKPNGLLVLEARKRIRSDKERLNLVLSGTCRSKDVDASNTILSTLLYDLNVVKEHSGELSRSTKKGWLTQALETLFNF